MNNQDQQAVIDAQQTVIDAAQHVVNTYLDKPFCDAASPLEIEYVLKLAEALVELEAVIKPEKHSVACALWQDIDGCSCEKSDE